MKLKLALFAPSIILFIMSFLFFVKVNSNTAVGIMLAFLGVSLIVEECVRFSHRHKFLKGSNGNGG